MSQQQSSGQYSSPSSPDSKHTDLDSAWREPILVDDEDLTFDGKPLNMLYEENRWHAEHQGVYYAQPKTHHVSAYQLELESGVLTVVRAREAGVDSASDDEATRKSRWKSVPDYRGPLGQSRDASARTVVVG